MPELLKNTLDSIRQMMRSADIDYTLLQAQAIDPTWLADYNHQRIVNSFLFNYLKIQDKIGSKLFTLALQQWRELDSEDMTMLDILNRLEKLGIIESVEAWDKLREIRNAIIHEYPEESQLRIENIQLALRGYRQLVDIVAKLELRSL